MYNLLIMEDVDEKLKKKLETIGTEIDKKYENAKNNINKTMNELTINLKKAKEKIDKNSINIIPKIKLIPDINNPKEVINFFTNAILFLFSNLEIINEFCLGDEHKEILGKLPNKNEKYFIQIFIDLIYNMRKKLNRKNIDYQPIHNYLKDELKDNYLNQNPKFLIRKFLIMIESDINKTNTKNNIITDNFCLNLKKIKKCNKCNLTILISEEKKLLLDLFQREEENKNDIKELKHELRNLLLESVDIKIFCPKCNVNMDVFMKIEEPKKYLIFNLTKNEKIKNTEKLIYSNNITLTEEKEGKKYNYEYELISALADKNTKIQDKDNIDINKQNKYILYFKNFINTKWYKLVNGKHEDILGNIQDDINKHNPNILIYKKKLIQFGK